MKCQAVRGATTVTHDDREVVLKATREMLALIIRLNGIDSVDLASAFFTATTDIHSVYPALAARQLGWLDVPLMCGQEIDVVSGLPLCIRVMIHWNTDKPQSEIQHVYLGEAKSLRPDKTLVLSGVDMDDLNDWIDKQLAIWHAR